MTQLTPQLNEFKRIWNLQVLRIERSEIWKSMKIQVVYVEGLSNSSFWNTGEVQHKGHIEQLDLNAKQSIIFKLFTQIRLNNSLDIKN